MLSATQFYFDNIFSGNYGLVIAEINQENVQESTPFVATIHTAKTGLSDRFTYSGTTYDEPLTKTFNVYTSDGSPISDIVQREISSWLFARKGFHKLRFLQPDLMDYEYNCIFGEVGKQFVNGFMVGYTLTATFDSHFAYGEPTKKTETSDGSSWVTTKIANHSDIQDNYTYPIISFSAVSSIDGKSIQIINESDKGNPGRVFDFGEISPTEKIIIDNNLKIVESNEGGDKLGLFNKNWLRFVGGINTLKVKINGTFTIECPALALIGW